MEEENEGRPLKSDAHRYLESFQKVKGRSCPCSCTYIQVKLVLVFKGSLERITFHFRAVRFLVLDVFRFCCFGWEIVEMVSRDPHIHLRVLLGSDRNGSPLMERCDDGMVQCSVV